MSKKFNFQVAVPGSKMKLGEGPHWVEEKQELIYVDIPGRAVHRHVPSTGADYVLPTRKFCREIDSRPHESQGNWELVG